MKMGFVALVISMLLIVTRMMTVVAAAAVTAATATIIMAITTTTTEITITMVSVYIYTPWTLFTIINHVQLSQPQMKICYSFSLFSSSLRQSGIEKL
jgi:hypothetical protein